MSQQVNQQAEYEEDCELIDYEGENVVPLRRSARKPDLGTRKNPVSQEGLVEAGLAKAMPPSVYRKSRKANIKLQRQTAEMAATLKEFGVFVEQKSNITQIGNVTGLCREETAYRNTCFLPVVAQKNRREQINSLEYHVKDSPYWRYLVITYGQRIPAFGPLKEAKQAFTRQISKWASAISEKYGIDVAVSVMEFPRDADGTYHLHSNVIYRPPFFADGEWEEFLEFTHKFFGTVLKDNGPLKNVNEAIKYPFKPNSLDGASGEELVWLFEQTFGTRIFSAMGSYRLFRRQLKKDGQKVARMNGRLVLAEKNNLYKKTDEEKLEMDQDRDAGDAENIILAETAPQFLTPWAEPVTLIQNYNPNPKGKKSLERLMDFWMRRQKHREMWDNAGGPDPEVARNYAEAVMQANNVMPFTAKGGARVYKVHKETITVQKQDKDHPEIPDIIPWKRRDGTTIDAETGELIEEKVQNSQEAQSATDFLAIFD